MYKVRIGRVDLVEKWVKLLLLRDVLFKCNLVVIVKVVLIYLEVIRDVGLVVILGECKM